ncbi:MAG: hypothetical protein ACP5N3_02635 [Candidatus Nanoarchaeia archaeon]
MMTRKYILCKMDINEKIIKDAYAFRAGKINHQKLLSEYSGLLYHVIKPRFAQEFHDAKQDFLEIMSTYRIMDDRSKAEIPEWELKTTDKIKGPHYVSWILRIIVNKKLLRNKQTRRIIHYSDNNHQSNLISRIPDTSTPEEPVILSDLINKNFPNNRCSYEGIVERVLEVAEEKNQTDRIQIIEQRLKGVTFNEIAKQLGMKEGRAAEMNLINVRKSPPYEKVAQDYQNLLEIIREETKAGPRRKKHKNKNKQQDYKQE